MIYEGSCDNEVMAVENLALPIINKQQYFLLNITFIKMVIKFVIK